MTLFDTLKAEMMALFSGRPIPENKKVPLFTIHIPLEDGGFEKYQGKNSWDPPREFVIGPLSLESAREWLFEQGFTGGWITGFYDIPQTIGSIKMTLAGVPPFSIFPDYRKQVRVEPVFELNHFTVVDTRK